MSLKRQALFGLGWLGLLRGATRGIDFIRIAITARILSQSAFGVFALVTATVNLLEALTETGFAYAIIHKQSDIKKYAKTLLVLNTIRGIVLMFFNIILAKIVSLFFNSPQVFSLLLIASIIPLIKGIENPYTILFYQELKLHKEFIYRFIPNILTAIISIYLSYQLHSALALVLGLVIGTTFEAILSYIIIKPDLSAKFDKKLAKELYSFGKWLTIGGVFTFLLTQIDNIFIGKFFGITILGIYDLAYKLANIAFSEITDLISKISFPLFAKLKHDKKKLYKALTSNILITSFPAVIITIAFLTFPNFFLTVAFGKQWQSGAKLLQILSLYGLLRAVVGPIGPLLLAMGNPRVLSYTNIAQCILLVIILIPFSHFWQVSGVAYAVVISYVLVIPYLIYQTKKILHETS